MLRDAGIVVRLIGLGFAAKPAYHGYRGCQVHRNLAAAKAAPLHEDWGTARDKARSVLLVRRNDCEALRLMAPKAPQAMAALLILGAMEIVKAMLAAKAGARIAAAAAWVRVMNQAAFDASRNRFIEFALEGCARALAGESEAAG